MRLHAAEVLRHERLVLGRAARETVERRFAARLPVATAQPLQADAESREVILVERLLHRGVPRRPVELRRGRERILLQVLPLDAPAVARRGVVGRDVVGGERAQVLLRHDAALLKRLQAVVAPDGAPVDAKRRLARHAVRQLEREHLDLERNRGRRAVRHDRERAAVDARPRPLRRLHAHPEWLVLASLHRERALLRRQRIRPKRTAAHRVGRLLHPHVAHAQDVHGDTLYGRRHAQVLDIAARTHHELHGLGLVLRRAHGDGCGAFRRQGARTRDLPAARSRPHVVGVRTARHERPVPLLVVERRLDARNDFVRAVQHVVGGAKRQQRRTVELGLQRVGVDLEIAAVESAEAHAQRRGGKERRGDFRAQLRGVRDGAERRPRLAVRGRLHGGGTTRPVATRHHDASALPRAAGQLMAVDDLAFAAEAPARRVEVAPAGLERARVVASRAVQRSHEQIAVPLDALAVSERLSAERAVARRDGQDARIRARGRAHEVPGAEVERRGFPRIVEHVRVGTHAVARRVEVHVHVARAGGDRARRGALRVEREGVAPVGRERDGLRRPALAASLRHGDGSVARHGHLPNAPFNVLPETLGDQFHAEVAGMVVAAVRVLARAHVLHVHEHVAVLLRHGCLLGVQLRTDVETLREKDERLPLGVEVGAERVERLAERAGGRGRHRSGVVVLRHVCAEEEHDHVGLELARPLEVAFARPVLLEERALNGAGHLEEAALRVRTHGGDLLLEEVHVVLVARARGHAPVVRPADLRTRTVQRNRVAHEQDARPLLRGVERLLVLRVLPECGHGIGLEVVGRNHAQGGGDKGKGYEDFLHERSFRVEGFRWRIIS